MMILRRHIIVLALGCIIFLLALKSGAQQATPQILLTWRADTYAPPDYSGRRLPTTNSMVRAAVEVIDAGKIVSLPGQTIYWYLNDNFLQSGANRQTVTFLAPPPAGKKFELRVELPAYRGGLLKTVEIPVVPPETVIEVPFPKGVVSGSAASVKARPYFFNVRSPSALRFLWSVNGKPQETSEDPQAFTVTLAPSALSEVVATILLDVENTSSPGETTFESATVVFRKK